MTEDTGCYGSPGQRELIKVVAGNPLFHDFFLTGGTCLSVFYLHHRVSNDLDFFTTAGLDLTEMATSVRALLQPARIVAAGRHFFSCVVGDVKLDLVVDPLSSVYERPVVLVDQVPVTVDRLENIGPNKICALISRTAPKDVVDCYVLYRQSRDLFMRDYRIAREREALLDDLMYAGEKLQLVSEMAPRILLEIGADLRVAVPEQDLADYYAQVGDAIFRLACG